MEFATEIENTGRTCVQCRKEKICYGRFTRCRDCRKVNQLKRKEADARKTHRNALVETQAHAYAASFLAYSFESDPGSDDAPTMKPKPNAKSKLLTELRGSERREAEKMIGKALQPEIKRVIQKNKGAVPYIKAGIGKEYLTAVDMYSAIGSLWQGLNKKKMKKFDFKGHHTIVPDPKIDHAQRAYMVAKELRSTSGYPFNRRNPIDIDSEPDRHCFGYECTCQGKQSLDEDGGAVSGNHAFCGGVILISVSDDTDSHPFIVGQQVLNDISFQRVSCALGQCLIPPPFLTTKPSTKIMEDDLNAFDAPSKFLETSDDGEIFIQTLIKEEAQALEVLSSQVMDLVKTVDEKRRRLARLRSLISPVTRLPTEILIQIFNITYSEQHGQPEDSDAQHRETPPLVSSSPSVFLSQVCSRWRSVVLDMPALWTNIAVSFETLNQAKAQVSLAHLFIDRTNGEPYHLDVVDRTPAAQTSSRQLRRLLAYHPEMVVQLGLGACPERLGILSTFPRGLFRRLVCVSLQILLGIPGLREGAGLTLERNEEHAAFNDGSVLLSLWGDYPTVWDIAPGLTDISISVEDLGRRRGLVKRVDLFLPGLHLPWERMRNLTLGTKFTGTFDMLGLLGRCSRLESLDIFLPHATSLPPIPIHLPVLRKLNLCFSHFSARHLDDLFLPKLEELNLEGSVRGVVFVGEAIVSLLERSGRPKLRHLGLAVLFTHSREVIRAAVAAGPSLESLTLRDLRSDLVEGPQVWTGILRGFHAIDGFRRSLGGESDFCPNLSSLSFSIPDATEPQGFLLALQELLWQRGWGHKSASEPNGTSNDFARPIKKLSLRAAFSLPGFWKEFVDHCQLQNEELEIVSISSSLSSDMLKCRNTGERYAWPSI